MKFSLLIATVSAIRQDPIRSTSVSEAADNHYKELISYEKADNQADTVRHHYGAFTPSGTNWQTFGNESTGGFYGSNRIAGIENTSSMLPHGNSETITPHIIRAGRTNVINANNIRMEKDRFNKSTGEKEEA